MVIMLQTWGGAVPTKTTRKMKTNVAIVKKPFEIEGDESYDVGSEAIILTAFNTKKNMQQLQIWDGMFVYLKNTLKMD